MNNPLADPYLILSKVYLGGKFLKQSIAETQTDPTQRARAVKVCYGVLEKDVALEYIISRNTEKMPRGGVKLILKIALYMLEFMDKHDYMVVDSAVQLAKKAGKGGAAGFVNAFLRGYKMPPLPENALERLSVQASAPLWLAKRIRRTYKEEALDILSSLSLGQCVRFVRGEEEYLAREHTDTPFEHTYIFPSFVRDDNFFLGNYTFQSVGSVAICSMVKGSPQGTLLDACAAPGGKSVLLSSKFSQITAQEIHPHRTQLILDYASRMGVQNITAVTGDATQFIPEYAGKYDAVLCDVPCSGSGVINENPDIKLFRKEEDIASLNKVQLAILSNCSSYVRPGGMLYYSTCSVLPEENDSIIYAFLESQKGFAPVPGSCLLAHRDTRYGMQFLPDISLGAGFYACAMQREEE
ncbi:MAG: hypothetical protein LUE27_11280 [Clostridia bacterium]|nr:hypothetical protein [Clostridia bacterium]